MKLQSTTIANYIAELWESHPAIVHEDDTVTEVLRLSIVDGTTVLIELDDGQAFAIAVVRQVPVSP